MPVDPRVEEAYRILLTPGGPGRTESRRARELLREWLEDEERAAGPGEDEEPDTSWEDVAPPELLNEKARAAARAAEPARAMRPVK